MNDFQNLVTQVRKLSLADQRVLNEILVGEIRHAVRVAAVTKSKEFKLGDIVSFVCTKRGRSGVKYVKVMDFSRDRTKVKGPEVSAKGEQMVPYPTTWTVAVSLLSKA
jgi:hypothetical protein